MGLMLTGPESNGLSFAEVFQIFSNAPSVHDVIDLQHCMENAYEATRGKGGIFDPVQQSMRHRQHIEHLLF
jgi:hypothetical protein